MPAKARNVVQGQESARSRAHRSDVHARTTLPENTNTPRGDKWLTSKEAAELLGVRSPNTIKNWLEGGSFPSAMRTPGGHWRFSELEVLDVKHRMQELREKNRTRDLAPPDTDEDAEPPLL